MKLEKLALPNNRIERVENVRHLKKLVELNLANNLIGQLSPNELPPNLHTLWIEGNLLSSVRPV